MKNLKDTFGRHFAIAGYLPALVLLVVVRLLIIPFLPDAWRAPLGELGITGLGTDLAALLVVPVFLAALLVGLGPGIVSLFQSDFDRFRPKLSTVQEHNKFASELRRISDELLATDDLEQRRALQADVLGLLNELSRITGGVLILDSAKLKPTRLGNVFAAMEEYPSRRYGMAAEPMWPRLQTVVPKELESRIGSQNSSFMFQLNLSICGLLFALMWIALGIGALFALIQVSALIWVIVFVGALVAVTIFYRWSVNEAAVLAQDVASAFDLYRGELLKQFRLSSPATAEEEAALWRSLALFIAVGDNRALPPLATPEAKEGEA